MSMAMVVEIGRDALFLTLLIAGPLLLAGLVVGLAVGIFQAVTQIHEMTLTFIPKILAVGITLLVLMPWMLNKAIDFFNKMMGTISLLRS